MTDKTTNKSADEPAAFVPLAKYDVPDLPTSDSLQILWTRMRELFRREAPGPLITDDRLRRSTLEMLDEIVSPPACGPLLEELQHSLADWLADDAPRVRNRLIVMPPGDRNNVIRVWAEQQGHEVLAPPDRDEIIGGRAGHRFEMPALNGDGVLVIPALEQWFMRHRNGLHLIRRLLASLDGLDRHVVVGCNSWAWQYLVRAVRADIIFGGPITFRAFDAHRLHDWFSVISVSEQLGEVRFLDSKTGEDVMTVSEKDDSPHDFLVSLAARSRGIPWVAWRLWRRSLRRRIQLEADADKTDQEDTNTPADPAEEAEVDDAHTLWVIALEEFSLPGADSDNTLLILQALLIHGPLTPIQLSSVLPIVGDSNLLSSLIAAGLVERDDDLVACAPAAYSAIRTGLTTAGFPIAEI